MDFFQAVNKCIRNYATFTGRASRSEYWYFALFFFIGHMITNTLDNAFFHANNDAQHTITTLFSLVLLLPAIAVAVRRMHDVNRSGWWLLIELTIIGIIYPILVWKCTKGTTGPNNFGPDPLDGSTGQIRL